MPVSAAERRFVLDNLTRLAEADIAKMWRAAELQTDLEFAAYVTQAFPDIVDPYHQMAAEFSATVFEEDFPAITSAAIVAAALPEEQLVKSAQWALGGDGAAAIDRMVGTTQRAIYNGDRETTTTNASKNGMRWVRVARPDACEFCKLLSSRTVNGLTYSGSGVRQKLGIDPDTGQPYADGIKTTVVYGRRRTESKQASGKEYHDNCHCVVRAIPVRTNAMEYLSATEPQFAELAQKFDDEYTALLKAAANAGQQWDTKKLLSEWRKADKSP